MSNTLDRRSEESQEESQDQGISLRSLTEAFAQAIGSPADAVDRQNQPSEESAGSETVPQEEPSPPSDQRGVEPEPPAAEQPQEDDEACRVSPRSILEAMLFVGNVESRPLESRRAAELMRGVEAEEIPTLVEELNERYLANACPYHIVSEGSGYRMRLRKRFYWLRNKFYGRVREARLSQAAIDVLAIVAYRQPLTGEEIGRLRDKPSSHLLAQLVRRRLLRIERPEEKPRKALYYTTDRFLELFGLDSIEDLPQSEELENR